MVQTRQRPGKPAWRGAVPGPFQRLTRSYSWVLIPLLLAACSLNGISPVQPEPQINLDQAQATTTSIPLASQPDASPAVQTPTPLPTQAPDAISPKAARFAVAASNFRQVEDQIWVDVCIQLPDTQDWMIGETFLQVAGEHLQMSGGSLIDYQAAGANGAAGQRCDTLTFDLPPGLRPGVAELTILNMQAFPREGQYCNYLLDTVQPTLQARRTGIQLACEEGPGYSNPQVVSKPDSMSQELAEGIAFSSEYYSIAGPWSLKAPAVPSATPYPTVALDSPQASPYDLLQTLYQKADAGLSFPGWVYTEENWQHDIDQGSYGSSAAGTSLPRAYQRQTWYHLDESGRVIQSVEQLFADNGALLETTVFTNGLSHSSGTGGRLYAQQPYRLHLDAQYIGNLEANLDRGNGSADRIEFEGSPAIQFTLDESFAVSDPQWYSQPIQSDRVTAIFDTATGQLRQIKTVVNLADGSQRSLEFMQFNILSGLEPPSNVLEILANAQNP